MTDESEMIEVRRDTIELLVESLDDAWWVQAARALGELRLALINVEAKPPPDTFGGS